VPEDSKAASSELDDPGTAELLSVERSASAPGTPSSASGLPGSAESCPLAVPSAGVAISRFWGLGAGPTVGVGTDGSACCVPRTSPMESSNHDVDETTWSASPDPASAASAVSAGATGRSGRSPASWSTPGDGTDRGTAAPSADRASTQSASGLTTAGALCASLAVNSSVPLPPGPVSPPSGTGSLRWDPGASVAAAVRVSEEAASAGAAKGSRPSATGSGLSGARGALDWSELLAVPRAAGDEVGGA
jgi:hypothetical protein